MPTTRAGTSYATDVGYVPPEKKPSYADPIRRSPSQAYVPPPEPDVDPFPLLLLPNELIADILGHLDGYR